MLGLGKKAPDEFAVYSRAPLSLPPDFGLRPPEPGNDRPQLVMPSDQAKAALAGGKSGTQRPAEQAKPAGGPGVQALLRELKATDTDPNIRSEVNAETSILAQESISFADKLIFWRQPDLPGTVVDAAKESKRLQETKALGRPINEGDVPTITKKKKGLFEGIF